MASVAAPGRRTDTGRRMTAADTGSGDEADEALMLAYARGDAAAFERLYARHKGPTYRYLLRHTADRALTDELHQDVWLRLVRARERYVADARFTTWLYTLARHRLVDHWRARHGTHFVPLDDEDGDPSPHGDLVERALDDAADPLTRVIGAQAGERLVAALADVPVAQRDAFLLHIEGGLSLAEIAQLTGVPAETVKSRLRYAYARLRTALEDLQ